MAKIIKVEIQNFQSHKNSVIELHKGLNVITGPSDSGKSAIIRAIKWVLYNEPRGSDYVRISSNQCIVTLHFDNGTIISRERTATKNRYILRIDGKDEIYEGFGNTVPFEIVERHQIRNLYLDSDQKSSINLSNQLEGPFLLSQSGAIKAKAIGRILGIHYLDSAARKATANINELKREYSQCLEGHKEIKEKLKAYDIYTDHQMTLEIIESNYQILKNSYLKMNHLKRIAQQSKQLAQDISNMDEIIKKTNGIFQLEAMVKVTEALQGQRGKLASIKFNLGKILTEIDKACKVIKETENYSEIENKVTLLSNYKDDLLKYKNLSKIYISNEEKIDNYSRFLKVTTNVGELEKDIIKLMDLNNNLEILKGKYIALNRLNEKLLSTKVLLENTKAIDYIDSNIKDMEVIDTKIINLIKLSQVKKETEYRIAKGNDFLQENTAQLNKLLKDYQGLLARTPLCPICEAKIDDERTAKLVEKWRN